jgi:hypothetical protein
VKVWLAGAVLLASLSARADLTLSSRYEYIGGENKEEMANRLLLHSKLNAEAGHFKVFAEGFGDFDSAQNAEERRSPHRGYLQETYLEVKAGSSYFRLGQQAMRWSDSWVVPSLDVWTGRRYNRLFFDPFADQLTHSQGASYSYESESFGLDLVGISKLAETYYPEPLPETMTPDEHDYQTGYGARVKINGKGVAMTALAARVGMKNVYGMTANYAFEKAVPKIELGGSRDNSATADPDYADEYFGSLGCDLFLGNFVLLPMVTFYDSGKFSTNTHDYKALYYVSMVWNPNRHDLQAQVYYNSINQDAFASLSYGYNITDWFTLTGFVQYYEGSEDTLFAIYKNMTGGSVAGIRFEVTGNLPF